jgi:nucleotide-binding universal stress UspA family protein
MSNSGMDFHDANPKGGGHEIKRILVALDPSPHSLAALEAAAAMALRLGAELLAVFIEDVNIRRLTQIPFVQEVGFYSGRCRRVETQELSRQLRAQAGRMRRRFRVTTRQIETRCTFRTIRGRVVTELLGAAAEADVVILGKGAWSPFSTERLAPDVREVLRQAPASTLVLRAETRVEPPMRVVYDGTPLADKALAMAAALVRNDDGHMMIFALADDLEAASRLKKTAQRRLAGTGLELTFHALSEVSVSRLAHLVAHEERGTLVLPTGPETLKDEAVLDFLDKTRAPVLMVR